MPSALYLLCSHVGGFFFWDFALFLNSFFFYFICQWKLAGYKNVWITNFSLITVLWMFLYYILALNFIENSEHRSVLSLFTHHSVSFLFCMFECRIFFSIIIIEMFPHEMSTCLIFLSFLKWSDLLSTIFGLILLTRNFSSSM